MIEAWVTMHGIKYLSLDNKRFKDMWDDLLPS
jgi:hypothetical protein